MCEMLVLIKRCISESSIEIEYDTGKGLSQNVKQYIDENFKEEITLAKLSEVFHMSTYHISHEMRKDIGVSPINYLISRRIGEAQRLLLSSNLTIAEIAYLVGYANTSYFMNLFHKRVGLTPTRFKEIYVMEKENVRK